MRKRSLRRRLHPPVHEGAALDDDIANVLPGVYVGRIERRGLTRFPDQYEIPASIRRRFVRRPALLQEIERLGLLADGDDPQNCNKTSVSASYVRAECPGITHRLG
jgi:hypothetical protein